MLICCQPVAGSDGWYQGRRASTWEFAIYRASHDDYQDSYLPSGEPSCRPEEALDCPCGLYRSDAGAWLPSGTDTPM
jgi:hypothetical protein